MRNQTISKGNGSETIQLSPRTTSKAFLSFPKESLSPLCNYYLCPLLPPLSTSHLLPSLMFLLMGNLCATSSTGVIMLSQICGMSSLESEVLSASLLFPPGSGPPTPSSPIFSFHLSCINLLSVRTTSHSHLLFWATVTNSAKLGFWEHVRMGHRKVLKVQRHSKRQEVQLNRALQMEVVFRGHDPRNHCKPGVSAKPDSGKIFLGFL